MTRRLCLAALALQLVAPLGSLQAQVSAPRSDSLIPDSRLFVKSDLYVLAGFAAATVAMFPVDRRLASSIRRDHLIDNRALQNVEDVLNVIGGPAPILLGGAMYVVGRAADRPRLAHVALHAAEAIVVGLATAGTLKMLAGRERPYASADSTPHDFGFGRGFEGERYQAFPSGHATVSFAVAAALLSESEALSRRARWIVGSTLFGGAAVVGLSRMYADRHWASDVVMGAAIGTVAGLKTVRFNHTHTGNRVDRWLLGGATSLRVLPGAGGDWRLAVDVSW